MGKETVKFAAEKSVAAAADAKLANLRKIAAHLQLGHYALSFVKDAIIANESILLSNEGNAAIVTAATDITNDAADVVAEVTADVAAVTLDDDVFESKPAAASVVAINITEHRKNLGGCMKNFYDNLDEGFKYHLDFKKQIENAMRENVL